VSGSSVSLQPAGLQVLAGHLHRAGLLPKWVYWLLKQMPQRPELYERAFNRLFQQVGTGMMHVSVLWHDVWCRVLVACVGSSCPVCVCLREHAGCCW
jgi:hypothetical protein